MKKRVLFALPSLITLSMFLFITTNLYSQITILSENFPSAIGTYVVTEDDTVDTVEVNPGSPGENQVWRLDQIYPGEFSRQLIVDKYETNFYQDFPDANMVIRYVGNLGNLIQSYYFENAQGLFYIYQNKTSDSLVIQGIGVDSAMVPFEVFKFRFSGAVDIQPDLLFAVFPLQYNDSWRSVSQFSMEIDTLLFGSYVTLRTDIKDSIDCIVDGWGTIILPSASYECLRLKSYITLNENLYINGELIGTAITKTINYYWLASNYGIVAKIISHPNEPDDNFTKAKQISRLHLFDPQLEFSIPDTIAVPEDTVMLPINVTDLTSLNISRIHIELLCDTTIVRPVDVATSGSMTESWGNLNLNLSDSSMTLDFRGENALTGSGILCFLRFLVNPNAQRNDSSHITFQNVEVQEQGPVIITKNGLVKVALVFDIKGNISYYSNSFPISNTQISLNERNITTDADGNFFFHNVPLDSFDLIPSKDGELKNSISAFDASMILRYVVGLISLTPYQMVAADVTGNGSISALDASYILRYSVGLIDEFPIGNDWRFIPSEFLIDELNWHSAPDRIRYDPLNSDYLNQNFKGIIYGDVSGNWSNMLKIAKRFTGVAIVQLGDPEFIADNEFVIPIDIDSDAEMLSAYFETTYCSKNIDFNNLEFMQQSGTCFVDYEVDNENLKISIASAFPLNWKDGKIGLKFKMKDTNIEKKIAIKLNEVSLNEDLVKIKIMDNQSLLNPSKPGRLTLDQNYPNPFNSSTSITYKIPKSGHVRIKIYNTLGQLVNTLLDNDHESGTYHIQWNGKSNDNIDVPSGVYFYCLGISNKKIKEQIVKKMILIR
jgi:hypothetical protein